MYQGISFCYFPCVWGRQAFGHSSKYIISRCRLIFWIVLDKHIVMGSVHNCTVGRVKVMELSGNMQNKRHTSETEVLA